MIRYFVDGKEVSRGEAVMAWRASRTYRNARYPDQIFDYAERGKDDGGVTAHMQEAGIRIEVEGPAPFGQQQEGQG